MGPPTKHHQNTTKERINDGQANVAGTAESLDAAADRDIGRTATS